MWYALRGASLFTALWAAPCTAVGLSAQSLTEIARRITEGSDAEDGRAVSQKSEHGSDMEDGRGVSQKSEHGDLMDDHSQKKNHSQHRIRRGRNSTEQHVMVCNAYAYSKPLHVYNVRSQQRLTGKEPLAYKECGDYTVWLREGDQLDFRTESGSPEDDGREREAGEHSVGIFRAWGMPKVSSSLLLVPHRQAPGRSTAIAFESHIFKELGYSQLVVVDTYVGKGYGRLSIAERQNDTKSMLISRPEELHYDSAVTLKPGEYELVLSNLNGSAISVRPLTVGTTKTTFVVVRVGVGEDLHSKAGSSVTELPQELLLHQQAADEERSAAAPPRLFLSAFLAAYAAWLLA